MRKETETTYYITKQHLKDLLMINEDIIFVVSSSTDEEIKIMVR